MFSSKHRSSMSVVLKFIRLERIHLEVLRIELVSEENQHGDEDLQRSHAIVKLSQGSHILKTVVNKVTSRKFNVLIKLNYQKAHTKL